MYDPIVDGKRQEFGVSGWLYQSTMMLYDTRTLSLWSQIGSVAVSGTQRGKRLTKLAGRDTTWGEWRAAHPDTLVLSTETGYDRSYGMDMYSALRARGAEGEPTVPVTHTDDRLPPQTQVFGIEAAGVAKAYPVPDLAGSPAAFTDDVAGLTVEITNDPPGRHFVARSATGEELPHVSVYWYAWAAFHPDTQLYHAP